MVDVTKFKNEIKFKLSFTIKFQGKNFNKIVSNISDLQSEKIFGWIERIRDNKGKLLRSFKNLKYKNWKLKDLLIFRHAFSMNNVTYRILIVKVKNSDYIEFHLGNHKYYDEATGELFLKKSSKY